MWDLLYLAGAIWSAITRNIQWLAPTAANVALVIIGWRVARSVQRKQLATTLLSAFRYQETWLKASKAVYEKLERDREFDWSNLARRYYERQLSDEEEQLYESARTVLNLYELISVAVLTRAADEKMVREMAASRLPDIYRKLQPLISYRRHRNKDNRYWENLEQLAKRWDRSLRSNSL